MDGKNYGQRNEGERIAPIARMLQIAMEMRGNFVWHRNNETLED